MKKLFLFALSMTTVLSLSHFAKAGESQLVVKILNFIYDQNHVGITDAVGDEAASLAQEILTPGMSEDNVSARIIWLNSLAPTNQLNGVDSTTIRVRQAILRDALVARVLAHSTFSAALDEYLESNTNNQDELRARNLAQAILDPDKTNSKDWAGLDGSDRVTQLEKLLAVRVNRSLPEFQRRIQLLSEKIQATRMSKLGRLGHSLGFNGALQPRIVLKGVATVLITIVALHMINAGSVAFGHPIPAETIDTIQSLLPFIGFGELATWSLAGAITGLKDPYRQIRTSAIASIETIKNSCSFAMNPLQGTIKIE